MAQSALCLRCGLPGVYLHGWRTGGGAGRKSKSSPVWVTTFVAESCLPVPVRFRIDWSGSENVVIRPAAGRLQRAGGGDSGSGSSFITMEVPPFTRAFAARLELEDENAPAVVKTSFHCEMLPKLNVQVLEAAAEAAVKEAQALIVSGNQMGLGLSTDALLREPSAEALGRVCRLRGVPFVDEAFPPVDRLDGRPVAWRRPSDIHLCLPHPTALFSMDPSPNDLRRGLICGAHPALVALAQTPALVREAFGGAGTSSPAASWGGYFVTLYPQGSQRILPIDDYLPCFPCAGAGTVCTSTCSGDIWAPLLEKALAKCVGGYEQFAKVDGISQLEMLTGCPTLRFRCQGEESCVALRHRLLEWVGEGWTVLATTPASRESNELLPGGVTYNVLGVLNEPASGPNLLLRVRGPQPKGGWRGSWHCDSALWTEEMRNAAEVEKCNGHGTENDEEFWMTISECAQNFEFFGGVMCDRTSWCTARRRISHLTSTAPRMYGLSILETTRAFIVLQSLMCLDAKRASLCLLRVSPDLSLQPVACAVPSPFLPECSFGEVLTPAQYLVVVVPGYGSDQGQIWRGGSASSEFSRDSQFSSRMSAALDEVFDRLDGDCDGILNASELECFMLEKEGTLPSREALDWMCENFDSYDGGLSRQGFHQVYKFMWQDSGRDASTVLHDLAHFGYNNSLRRLGDFEVHHLTIHTEAKAGASLVPYPSDPKAQEAAESMLASRPNSLITN